MKKPKFGGLRGVGGRTPNPAVEHKQVMGKVRAMEKMLPGDEEIESMPNNLEDCFSAEEIQLIQKMQTLIREINQGAQGIQTAETYIPGMTQYLMDAVRGLILEAGETINEKELEQDTICYNREAVIRNLKSGSQIFDRSLAEEKEGVRGIAAGWENAPAEVKLKMEELSTVAKELISLFDRE